MVRKESSKFHWITCCRGRRFFHGWFLILNFQVHTNLRTTPVGFSCDTVLSRGVRSLFGPTRKSSPCGNFSDGGLNQSIKRRLSLWTFMISLTWLVYWIHTALSVFTGAGLKWLNTVGQYSTYTYPYTYSKLSSRTDFSLIETFDPHRRCEGVLVHFKVPEIGAQNVVTQLFGLMHVEDASRPRRTLPFKYSL